MKTKNCTRTMQGGRPSLVEQAKIVLEQDTCHLMLGSWNYDVIIPNKNDVIIKKVDDVILRPCLATF